MKIKKIVVFWMVHFFFGLVAFCCFVHPISAHQKQKFCSSIVYHKESKKFTCLYHLSDNSLLLYPTAQWLPPVYKKEYNHTATTIKHYTYQSLNRSDINVTIDFVRIVNNVPEIAISGDDLTILRHFAEQHKNFLNIATQGRNGVALCKKDKGCWDREPTEGQPWCFFLPFGLPLIYQVAIMLIDYPTVDSLRDRDYLDNFTTIRVQELLKMLGVDNNISRYMTIVDTYPIAAPNGQSSYMPDITKYFNNLGTDHYYIDQMLVNLTDPPTNSYNKTIPIIVFGKPGREAFEKIIGEKEELDILDVGISTLQGAEKNTSWVITNHPDFTSYQCCPGDENSHCKEEKSNLVASLKIDLQALCIVKGYVEEPYKPFREVKKDCAEKWGNTTLADDDQRQICIRAKLDYNYYALGRCQNKTVAEKFCDLYQNNPCPPHVYNCDVSLQEGIR